MCAMQAKKINFAFQNQDGKGEFDMFIDSRSDPLTIKKQFKELTSKSKVGPFNCFGDILPC